MSSLNNDITEFEFQAYVDGELDAARHDEVTLYLKQHPEKATEIDDYQRYNLEMRQLFEPILKQEMPDSMSLQTPQKPAFFSYAQAASLLLAVTIGGVVGWVSHDNLQPPLHSIASNSIEAIQTVNNTLVSDAFAYHAVYTPEVKHPVEVGAKDQKHLLKWLSKRLNTTVKAPDLTSQGYELLGGRLLESGNSPAAQFMYENKQGKRLTLLTRHKKNSESDTSFRYATQGDMNGFYWIDGEQSFVILSGTSKQAISTVAHTVYQTYNEGI